MGRAGSTQCLLERRDGGEVDLPATRTRTRSSSCVLGTITSGTRSARWRQTYVVRRRHAIRGWRENPGSADRDRCMWDARRSWTAVFGWCCRSSDSLSSGSARGAGRPSSGSPCSTILARSIARLHRSIVSSYWSSRRRRSSSERPSASTNARWTSSGQPALSSSLLGPCLPAVPAVRAGYETHLHDDGPEGERPRYRASWRALAR